MSGELDPLSVVKNSERLTSVFGCWPSFHDAEVISVRLERSGTDEWEGPVLFAGVHTFVGRQSDTSPTGVEWYNHAVVTFRFGHVQQLTLADFNQQNAIFDLLIRRPPDAPSNAPFEVTFDSAHGVECSFYCATIAIAEVEQRLPEHSVYAPKQA